jgi:hypothetical protein
MSRTLTNNTSLSVAVEDSTGVLPGSPEWALLEPNAISTLGATVTTVARQPISKTRQRRKGSVTDLDSGFEFDADLTLEHVEIFAESFFYASWQGGDYSRPTSATNSTSEFAIPTIGTAYPANTLVYARGFTNAANNGLHLVDTGSSQTVVVVTSTLVDESPAATQNASLDECGFRFASGDAEIDANGDLITTTKLLTELPLVEGQFIWVGGAETVNQFATAANKGFCRVTNIAANKLTLDKTPQAFSVDAGTSKLIDIYFGRYLTNVAVDDANYLEQSLQFEAAYTDLGGTGTDEYEYAKGNYANTLAIELPLTDKATMSMGFVGTDTEPPSTTRATNADAPIQVVSETAFNTSADIARLRIQDTDESGLTTDFKSCTININNNAGPEKVLGQLGAKYINTGLYEVDIEATIVFTDSDVLTRVRNNTTVTMDCVVRNDDSVLLFDVPSLTLGDGAKEYTVNESVTVNLTAQSFADATYDNSLSLSLFPYAPDF